MQTGSCKGLVINYGDGGGATKWENRGSETFCPSRQGKTFRAPPFKELERFAPSPFDMAKTSSYHVNTTPKLVVPPLSMAKFSLDF